MQRAISSGINRSGSQSVRMRFGIDMNTDHTLEEVGKQFDVTRGNSANRGEGAP